MSDIKAQSLEAGTLRPSGGKHKANQLKDALKRAMGDEQSLEDLAARRANWQSLNAVQRNQWIVDALTYLIINQLGD